MPWMTTRLLRSTRTLMTEPWRGGHELRWARGRNAFAVPPLALDRGGSPGCETALLRSCPPLPPRQGDNRRGRLGRGLRGEDARLLKQAAPLFFHGSGHTHHERLGDVQLVARGDDAASDFVPSRDPAEHVDEDPAHLGVEQHHLERVAHALRVRTPTDVEKVSGLAAVLLDEVERVHRQTCAVTDAADVAIEVHVGEAALACLDLERVIPGATVAAGLVASALVGAVSVPVARVLLNLELAVGGNQHTAGRQHQRVNLAGQRVE